MATTIKKVLVLGSTGNLGPYIVKGLLDGGFEVSAVTRSSSKAKPPYGIPSIQADYSSVESLTSAFTGFDAVVCTLGFESDPETPVRIIHACEKANVKRYVPSEFGSDNATDRSMELRIYDGRRKDAANVEQAAEEGRITYTSIMNGVFSQWMLGSMSGHFGFDPVHKRAEIFDGGDHKVHTTSLYQIGQAVAVALRKPEETKNKTILISGSYFTQREILEEYEKVTGGEKWTVENVRSMDNLNLGIERMKIAPGDFVKTIIPMLKGIIYNPYYNYRFLDEETTRNNELLEVKTMTREDLAVVMREVIDSAKQNSQSHT